MAAEDKSEDVPPLPPTLQTMWRRLMAEMPEPTDLPLSLAEKEPVTRPKIRKPPNRNPPSLYPKGELPTSVSRPFLEEPNYPKRKPKKTKPPVLSAGAEEKCGNPRRESKAQAEPPVEAKGVARKVAHIYTDQYANLMGMVEASPTMETGGDLFGRWREGRPVVEYVLRPGPKARGDATSFFQDSKFLETNGNALSRLGVEHIGEWHSHHSLGLAEPSKGDCETVKRAMNQYERDHFLLCIATLSFAPNSASPTAEVRPFLFVRNSTGKLDSTPFRLAQWHFIGDTSPHSTFKPLGLAAPVPPPSSVPPSSSAAAPASSQWYATTEGKKLLPRVFELCIAHFGEGKLARSTLTQDLEITFPKIVIVFPAAFPRQYAVLRATKPSAGSPASAEIRYRTGSAQFGATGFISAALIASIALL